MNHLSEVQGWLGEAGLDGIVVPSTDEFLSEFAPPAARRLKWVSGFRGSTGLAVVLKDAAALFLDGRYLQQATTEVDVSAFAVEAATPAAREAWLQRHLEPGARLGLDPWMHAAPELTQWQAAANLLGIELRLLCDNPIEQLWRHDRPAAHRPPVVDYPPAYAGEPYEMKCARLGEHIRASGLQALLLADPEDVSWLLNVRAAAESIQVEVGEWQIVPSCASRALVAHDGRVRWFVEASRLAPDVRARSSALVSVLQPDALASVLQDTAAQGAIGLDLRRTPAAIAAMVERHGVCQNDDYAARCRWRKHPAEIAAARRAHVTDAAAVVRFMAWLSRAVPERAISEFEAAEKLQQLRAAHPAYLAPSMPPMSASGLSGAQPHYVPSRGACRRLNDHPIFWMDSGGQYAGGTTDNTITLAVGTPERKHVLAHTAVLQGFVALAMARAPLGTSAYRLDALARQALWREGMDYAHGTGHGVGNYLNIHEGPLITREPGAFSSVPLEPGMIVTNEPGYYAAGDFGLRIECHMVVVASRHAGFIEFDVISRLPIDARLVDFTRLAPSERCWLAQYHENIVQDLAALLDEPAACWLRDNTQAFVRAARSAV